MAVERIAGAADPRVASFRDVPDAERLRSQRLFVAEGRLIVARILEDVRYRVRAVPVNDASYRELVTAFNAMIERPITEFVTLHANVYNLTDRYYYDQLHPAHIVLGPSRNTLIGIRFRF